MLRNIEKRVVLKTLKNALELHSISYGFVNTPFGEIFLGIIGELNDAICALYFVNKRKETCLNDLHARWPNAKLQQNAKLAERIARLVFDESCMDEAVLVVIEGTAFKRNVWESLLKVGTGCTCTYSQLATAMGRPTAIRAVAHAVAINEVSVLIPCHRVVSKSGDKFKYRWGAEIKKKLLDYEAKL